MLDLLLQRLLPTPAACSRLLTWLLRIAFVLAILSALAALWSCGWLRFQVSVFAPAEVATAGLPVLFFRCPLSQLLARVQHHLKTVKAK